MLLFRRSGIEKPTSEDYKERERELNKNLDEIEGIIEKVLKQTKDLLGQTWNDSSVEELSDRISHIKVSASVSGVNRCRSSSQHITKDSLKLLIESATLPPMSLSLDPLHSWCSGYGVNTGSVRPS